MISCSVFICQNNLKETQIEEECAVQKNGGYSGLLQACATSSRVLVVINTWNKYLRPRYQHTFCQRRKTTRNAIVLIK